MAKRTAGYAIAALKKRATREQVKETPKPPIMQLQHRDHCQVHSWETPQWINCDCGAIHNWYDAEIKRLLKCANGQSHTEEKS